MISEGAIHEAAHAFGFWLFGGLLEGVWCKKKEKVVRGYHPGRFSGGQDRIDEMVTILLAGPAAALRGCKNQWDPSIYREEEIKDCIHLLESRGWRMPDHWTEADFWSHYSPRARALCDDKDNWTMIEPFAVELERREYISGRETALFFEREWQKINRDFCGLPMPPDRGF
jgi:hypothetical protein